jgi:TatD DNase family protein
MFTDTHCHLYSEELKNDLNEVVIRAFEKGVTRIFLPDIDSSSTNEMFQLATKYPDNFFPMAGLHPCSVKEDYERELHLVENNLRTHKCYGVGETGIDLYWDKTHLEEQKKSFRKHISFAKEFSLPLIIHTRNSFKEIIEILNEENDESLKGIFHCFTGTIQDAEKIISYGGFLLGIGGVLTFKNSGLDKTIENVDMKHIVLETDSPYLAPVPYRGKRNEPSFIINVAEKLSEIKKVPIEKVAEITTQNSKQIFNV